MRQIGIALPVFVLLCQACFGAESPAPPTRNSIAVLDLANRNPGDGFDWLSKGLADMLISDLAASKKLLVVDRERTQDVVRELELDQAGLVAGGATRVGQVAKVDWVAFGSYSCRDGELAVELLLLDLKSQTILRIEKMADKLTAVSKLEQRLVRSLLDHIQLPMTEQELRTVSRLKTDSLPAFEHYSRSLAMFDDGRWYEALVETRLARKADPAYQAAAARTALLYHELGADDHALVEYEALLAADRDNTLGEIEYFRTACLLDEDFNRRKDAIALLNRVLARYPLELPSFDVLRPTPLFEQQTYSTTRYSARAIGQRYGIFMKILERLGSWNLEEGRESEAARLYSWFTDFLWRNGMPYGPPGDQGLATRVAHNYTPLYWRMVSRNQDAGLHPPTTVWLLESGKAYDPSAKPSHGHADVKPLMQSCLWLAPPGQEIDAIELIAKPPVGPVQTRRDDGMVQLTIRSVPEVPVTPVEDPKAHPGFSMFAPDGAKHVLRMKAGVRFLQTQVFHTDQWELRFTLRPWSKVDLAAIRNPRYPMIYIVPDDGKITIDGVREGHVGVNFHDTWDSPAARPGEHEIVVRWPNGIVKREKLSVVEGGVDLVVNSRCDRLSHTALAPVGSHPFFLLDRQQKIWLVWDQNRLLDYSFSPNNDSDLYAATSRDGVHWSPPRRLPVSSSSARDSQGQLQQDPHGVFWLVWTVHRDQKKSLCIARSADGIAWSFPRKIVLPDAVKNSAGDWRQTQHSCGFAIDQRGTFWLEWESYLLGSKDGEKWEVDSSLNTDDEGEYWGRGKSCFLTVDALNNLVMLASMRSRNQANMGATLWRRSDGDWQKLGRAVDDAASPIHVGSVSAGRDGSLIMATAISKGVIARQWRPSGQPLDPLQLTAHHNAPATPAILQLPDGRVLLSYASVAGIVVESFKIDERILPAGGPAGRETAASGAPKSRGGKLLQPASAGVEPEPTSPPALKQSAADREIDAQIERHVQNLGNDSDEIATAAEAALVGLSYRAAEALEKASKQSNSAVATRAARALAKILLHTNVVIDAVGQPIVGGTLEITFGKDGKDKVRFTPDARGHVNIAVPKGLTAKIMSVRFSHPDYGIAEGMIQPETVKEFAVPLVKRGSPAYERALKGTVVDPENKPIAGAIVKCGTVRTARGDFLVAAQGRTFVRADDEGRFAVYPVATPTSALRPPTLIAAGAKFELNVETTDETLFPHWGKYANTTEVKVEVQRPTHFYKLKFERRGGGFVEDANRLASTTLNYFKTNRDLPVSLDHRIAQEGAKLPPGLYLARWNSVSYLPLELTADSPDELVFHLPPSVTYRGRVVDGITGAPVANACVFGSSGISNNRLAQLSADQWKSLRESSVKDLESALKKIGYLEAFTRTDSEGKYEIVQKGETGISEVVAAEENFLPTRAWSRWLKVDAQQRAAVPDLPLLPAARIRVKTVCPNAVLVQPKIHVQAEGQPEWFDQLQRLLHLEEIAPPQSFFLPRAAETFYVPAGIGLSLELIPTSTEEWSSARPTKVIRLVQGEIRDLGTVELQPALKATVSVVDAKGAAVEGARVARVYKGGFANTWRMTDAAGQVSVFLNRDSTGRFEVTLPPSKAVSRPANPVVAFEIGEQMPGEVYKIVLTDAQFRLVRPGPAKTP